jgi:N-acetylated-alpha-linked acidic dipeptidase
MAGFTVAHAATERELETRFDSHIDIKEMRSWLEQMSSAPNHVGSPHDKANAEFMLAKFREWGWDAQLETFQVLYPMLKSHSLEMLSPTSFKASLTEPAVDGDGVSSQTDAELAPYNVYGADGDVTGELVYVNHGMPDDYKELARHGVSVKGRIAIARYGGGWRGLKPKLAFEHGAIGCLIYSDPADDGYSQGDIYPKGAWRPPEGVQRGSVLDMAVYPGDPLTPGIGATAEAKRLSISEAKTILKIPVMPISYADAQPLLAALDGPVAPANWRGSLPITYHLGAGPAKVHLVISSDWSLKTIYDVIAKIRGSERPDEWILRGNHHDGWVAGAWDPLSGNICLMDEAKAIGALVRDGWSPRRTLVYCGWDAEEPGLIGSTEWVETHVQELRQKAVLYVNSDSNSRGFLRAAGSQEFQAFVDSIAADVSDPEIKTNALARLRAKLEVDGIATSAEDEAKHMAKLVADRPGAPIGALGSGSDYTPFLQYAGIPALSLEYGGQDKEEGIYHSAYDSFEHYTRYGDPSFLYARALAQTIGRAVMRSAQADVIPMQFSDFAESASRYVIELHELADSTREKTEKQHKLLDSNAYELARNIVEPVAPPEREPSVPYFNFAPLDNAITRLKNSAKEYDEAVARALSANEPADSQRFDQVNEVLRHIEQQLIDDHGLPGRDWFKHMIYAPGLHTGYGVKTMPGVREAIEERHWTEVDEYVPRISAALNRVSDDLDRIVKMLNSGSPKAGKTVSTVQE